MLGRETVQFLHVGKTGGTAVREALHDARPPGACLVFHGHTTGLQDVAAGRAVFFLRDPISRFESGFYSRLRKGLPRYYVPWDGAEAMAFAAFQTADALAKALYGDRHSEAAAAMNSIKHVNGRYSDWLGSEAYLLARQPDLYFIGFQESLAEDFRLLARKLRVGGVALPTDPVLSHRRIKEPSPLGETAREKLRRWYQEDYRILDAARDLASIVNERP